MKRNIGTVLLALYLILDSLLGFGVVLGPFVFLLYVMGFAGGVCLLIGK